jgi:hypothetical protein
MVLTQEIAMTFIDRVPIFCVFRKIHTTLASKFSTSYDVVSKFLQIKEVQFKAPLKRYLNTSFYSVSEFLMFKNES